MLLLSEDLRNSKTVFSERVDQTVSRVFIRWFYLSVEIKVSRRDGLSVFEFISHLLGHWRRFSRGKLGARGAILIPTGCRTLLRCNRRCATRGLKELCQTTTRRGGGDRLGLTVTAARLEGVLVPALGATTCRCCPSTARITRRRCQRQRKHINAKQLFCLHYESQYVDDRAAMGLTTSVPLLPR